MSDTAKSSYGQETLPSHYLQPPADSIDAELRRRIFWSIFLFDRLGSSATGWTFSLNRRDHGVDLPGHDAWDSQSGLTMPLEQRTSGAIDSINFGGRKPRAQSSFRFPPADRVAIEIEAPNPHFRWSDTIGEDITYDDRTPLSLLVGTVSERRLRRRSAETRC